MRPDDLVVVVTTVETEEQALDIGQALVRQRAATCVNIVRDVRSIYRWKGKLCDDGEYLLLIKTVASEFPAVTALIKKLHSYELPEILSYRVDEAEPLFGAWVKKMVAKPVRRPKKKPPKKK